MGWQCPGCGACFALEVSECWHCDPQRKFTTRTTSYLIWPASVYEIEATATPDIYVGPITIRGAGA